MENKKRKALIIIICCSAFFLAGTTILLFFMLQKEKSGFDTPEAAAEKIMNASVNKDWKTIIDLTTDDTLEMLLQADAEKVKAKDISSAAQLRDWAEQNAATVPDPMNGKTILQYSLGETQTMSSDQYVKYFLGGEGDNAYYPFLKSKEEIAVVELKYTMQDGNEERERSDSVVSFKSDGRWYPLTGVQVIDSMLGMN